MRGLLVISLLLCVVGVSQAALTNHWYLDETTGLTVADSVGGNTGTVNQETAVDLTAVGVINTGVDFAGQGNGGGYIAASNVFTGNAARAISVWFNADEITGNQARLIGMGSGAAGQFDITVETFTGPSIGLRYGNGNMGWSGAAEGFTISPDTWYHVVVQYDGTTLVADSSLEVYLNGTKLTRDGGNNNNSGQVLNTPITDFWIGRDSSGGRTFNGTIDEVQVFDALLTPEEIAQLSKFSIAMNPDPSAGETGVAIDLSGGVVPGELSWDAPDAYLGATYNVYFGSTEPNFNDPAPYGLTQIGTAGQSATSAAPALPLSNLTPYYWVVDSLEPNDVGTQVPILHVGRPWSFTTKPLDAPPVADAGDSIITTTALAAAGFTLGGSVTDDGVSALSVSWEAYEVVFGGGTTSKVSFADATDPNTSVTISEAGTYVVKLTATDDTGSDTDQKEITVYDGACDAAKATDPWEANYYDRDLDCDVDLADFAIFALEWLDSTALVDSYFYDQVVLEPSTEALISDYWGGISGVDPNDLLAAEDYPDNPLGTYLVTGELRSKLVGDSFGERIYGYLVPPATGNYTFYLASDDGSRLFLNSAGTAPVDTDPVLGNHIASVTGYTGVDEWTSGNSTPSAPISLTADQYYYIEVLFKESGGANHMSVGWSTDGGTTIEVIPASALRYALP